MGALLSLGHFQEALSPHSAGRLAEPSENTPSTRMLLHLCPNMLSNSVTFLHA